MGMKGIKDAAVWKPFAIRMVDAFLPPPPGAILIPIPSSRGAQHALGLAEALEHLTGPAGGGNLGRAPLGHPQKTLRKKERRKIHFCKNSPATQGKRRNHLR